MPEIIVPLGREIGLTILDLALLIGCPIFAALGTTVSASIKAVTSKPEFRADTELPISLGNKVESQLSAEERLKLHNQELRKQFMEAERYRQRSEIRRLAFIGFVLGLVIALYFVGAITQSITSLARILALCVLLGYQAPNLWTLQEKLVTNTVEKRVKEMLGIKGKP
jgi:Flp pilus assembly protein TadB